MFSLNVPFNFPDFVNPAGKKIPKREKIRINLDAVTGGELLCKTISHPMKVRVFFFCGNAVEFYL